SSSAASNAPVGSDLILVLRNVGSKGIGITNLSVDNFSLQDVKGTKAQLRLSSPTGEIEMGYGRPAIIHLVVLSDSNWLAHPQRHVFEGGVMHGADYTGGAVEPWTLNFKWKLEGWEGINLTITNITPSKAAASMGLTNAMGFH
ncbi:MAG TPA: hypothetical protein VN765_10430, partial [Candidatus Acidoferrum sp.]|nr:hypothetical protein [Candidatus Acidoferrum sp.]